MAGESEKESSIDAFPFETENPSNVPGVTEIQGRVVAAIAGHVAEQIDGVVGVGRGGLVRTMAGVLGSDAASKATGVTVEAGRKETIIDFDITVLYGHNIPGIDRAVRETVAREISEQVGLTAKEINVTVSSIEFPEGPAQSKVL